jgi:hypothetical protein
MKFSRRAGPRRAKTREVETRSTNPQATAVSPLARGVLPLKTIDAAFEKAKATSGTAVDSAALELICLGDTAGRRYKSGWQRWVPKRPLERRTLRLNRGDSGEAWFVIRFWREVIRDA